MNRELTRNLWTEITPAKLIVAPFLVVIINIILLNLDASISDDGSFLYSGTYGLLAFLLVIGGAKHASEAIINEVNERTWVLQKMTDITAWEMTLGKLFGSTIYIWYSAFFMIIAHIISVFYAANEEYNLYSLLYLLIGTVSGHAIILTFSLFAIKKNRFTKKLKKNSLFFFGVVLLFFLISGMSSILTMASTAGMADTIYWFSIPFSLQDFTLITLIYIAIWSIVALYRNMRIELQYRNMPWVWFGFIFSFLIYLLGFFVGVDQSDSDLFMGVPFLFCVVISLLVFTYASLLMESFDPTGIRKVIDRYKNKDFKGFFSAIPVWMINLGLLAIFAFPLLHLGGSESIALIPLILLFFVIRDVSLFFIMKTSSIKRGDFFIIIYLVLVYWLLPWLFSFGDSEGVVLNLFWPNIEHQGTSFAIILIEAGAAITFLWKKRTVFLKVN
jgi:hypothetical protein